MPRINIINAAIREELKHWPNVSVKFASRSKHKEARFFHGDKSRFVTVPSTASDHRSLLNTVKYVKKELIALGAERLDTVPHVKKVKPVYDAKMSITDEAIFFYVSKRSPLHKYFLDSNGEPTNHWRFEMRDVPGREPMLAVVRAPTPEAGTKHPGVARGYRVKSSDQFTLHMVHAVAPIVAKQGRFAASPLVLYERTQDAFVFELPPVAERDMSAPVLKHLKPAVLVEKKEEVQEPVTTHVEHKLEPNQPVILQLPKEKISLERAVNVINAYKDSLGKDMGLYIDSDGYLRVTAAFGRKKK
jgi:hypothetical protein